MATKRRAEARWIESRSRWQINVQCDGVRKTFVSSTPKRAGKREVEEKADHWLETFDTQQRFAQAWAAYMEDKRKSVGASSYQRYQSAEAHIKPRIPPAKYIDRIAIYDWQKIIDEVAEDGSSKANLDVIRLLIVGFTDYARRRGWECRELHAGDLNTDAGKAKKARRALNKGELTSLMALDYRDTYLAFAFKFMVLTGIRRGEMMGLEWSDIMAAESKMHIARAINALGETTTGKTENAVRTVYASTMDPSALEYRMRRGLDRRDEQMAILVQRARTSTREARAREARLGKSVERLNARLLELGRAGGAPAAAAAPSTGRGSSATSMSGAPDASAGERAPKQDGASATPLEAPGAPTGATRREVLEERLLPLFQKHTADQGVSCEKLTVACADEVCRQEFIKRAEWLDSNVLLFSDTSEHVVLLKIGSKGEPLSNQVAALLGSGMSIAEG